jgi:tetratricopeptide (TPR) repeat protein
MGLISDALARYQESAHLMDQLAADFPSRHINRFNQAVAHTRLSDTLDSQGQQIEALAPLQRSITVREQMLAEWPDRPDGERVRHELARNYMTAMRIAYELGRMEEAVEHCHRALAYRRLLVELLAQDYPADHPVIAYEAATLPITAPRMETVRLSDLVEADLRLQTTLVFPPAQPMERNQQMLDRLADLDRNFARP